MSKRLFVGNLPFSLTKVQLEEAFKDYAPVEEATIITNKFSGRSKGFGFITIKDDALAERALKEMSGKDVGGRTIIVNEAKPMEEKSQRQDNSTTSS